MSRLIDADNIKEAKFNNVPYVKTTPTDSELELYMRGWNDAIDAIAECEPTVDAVEVIRKPIVGYEAQYEVDVFGRIYALDRVVKVNDNGRIYDKPLKGKLLRQCLSSNGYKTVALTKNGKSKTQYVHRLVAMAFIPNPENHPFINHKDEDRTNNFANNLEWCTNAYNVNYGTAKERRVKKMRGHTSSHAVMIEAFGEKHTRKEWGKKYGISPHTIEKRMRSGWDAEKAITCPLMKNQYAYAERRQDEAH